MFVINHDGYLSHLSQSVIMIIWDKSEQNRKTRTADDSVQVQTHALQTLFWKTSEVSLKLYLGYWDLGIEIVCLSLM